MSAAFCWWSRILLTLFLLLVPSPAFAQTGPIVALGDSYSSGEGVPRFVEGTAMPGVNTCHRSARAWPMLVAAETRRDGISFACSGARTAHVTTSNPRRSELERQTAQVERLAQVPSPDIVTITIGGNDVGFKDILTRCARLDRCDRHYKKGSEDVLRERIRDLESRLPDVYKAIQSAAPGARVIVVGYPRIFPRRPFWLTCAATMHARELEYLNSRTAELNDAIRRAAAAAEVRYIGVHGALDGHEIRCLGRRWVWGLAFLLVDSPISPYSFHPNRRGHRALATDVSAVL